MEFGEAVPEFIQPEPEPEPEPEEGIVPESEIEGEPSTEDLENQIL